MDDMICMIITRDMPMNIAATIAYAAAAHPPIFGTSDVRISAPATLATMLKRTPTIVIKLGAFVDFTFLPPVRHMFDDGSFYNKGHMNFKGLAREELTPCG
jgi:hypothetical protein